MEHLVLGAFPLPLVHGLAAGLLGGGLCYGLLCLLGIALLVLAPDRVGAVQVTMIRAPGMAALKGVVAVVATVVAIVALAVTIVGIPGAAVLALALPLALYAGLATGASVVGAALPIEGLKGRPLLQLLAGSAVLFIVSLFPILGGLVVTFVALAGFGALVHTRFATTPPPERLGPPAGPYRDPASV
jgi:hypothetical protein